MEIVARELAMFAAIGFLIGGIDDLVLDLIWLRHAAKRRFWPSKYRTGNLVDLPQDSAPGKMAIFVPAWDEADVIASMLEHAIRKLAGQNFSIFAGCYPNDPATIKEIESVASHCADVKMVIGSKPGPTTKADCLNEMWQALLREEQNSGTAFKAVILHDAEDLVHCDELAVYDRLIGPNALVQIPVVALVDRKSRWVGGHYCDEFAESHGKDLVVRDAIGAGVPSAGVGSAIERQLLGTIAAERGGLPFAADSLTEDYELGLRIAERGGKGTFARVHNSDGDLIAVKAHFPSKLEAATRQKSRWIVGIALSGWDRLGWAGGWSERWMRLRDRRIIIAALILSAAYVALALGLVLSAIGWFTPASLSVPSPVLLVLLQINLGLLVWRLAMRFYFAQRTYGLAEGLRSVPRALVSNFIAIFSARRALVHYLSMRADAPPKWEKTEHVFPENAS